MGSLGSGKFIVVCILVKKFNKFLIDIDNDILEFMWGVKISEKVIFYLVKSMFVLFLNFNN